MCKYELGRHVVMPGDKSSDFYPERSLRVERFTVDVTSALTPHLTGPPELPVLVLYHFSLATTINLSCAIALQTSR